MSEGLIPILFSEDFVILSQRGSLGRIVLLARRALAIARTGEGVLGALQTVWALSGAPPLVVDRHSPGEVGLL